ncbi:phage tail sheath family protein [Calothrix sp. FACHB-156]|nr:phage tail sheath family protein [Calothrix sp. FACHB-156]
MPTRDQIPGVYREISIPTPTPELLTGVPVFLGLTADRDAQSNAIPVNKPQQITLWPQFQQYFGQPLANSYLGYAVRGFFENGGQICYVLRLQDLLMESLQSALSELESWNTIDLICVPDLFALDNGSQQTEPRVMQDLILQHCEQMSDRFAILDVPNLSTINELQSQQSQNLSSLNGALYAPWIQVAKLEERSNLQQDFIKIPPCGHIAGIYARSDREIGVHKTPANYVLEGVVDLSIQLSDLDQITLNPVEEPGINCLRAFPGRGIRVWGARTLSREAIWRDINVRRLFLTVARWIDRNMADIAFEPNDFRLWVRIERELTAYFESLFQEGALQGRTPQQAFYVRCNANTNPPEVQDAGQVIAEIGLAPTLANEFIVIRLIHGETGVIVEG